MKNIKKIIALAIISIGLISNIAVYAIQENGQSVVSDTNNQTTISQNTDVSPKIDFSSEVDKAKKAIESLTTNNDTKESAIVGAVKDAINPVISVSFGDGKEEFNKIDATTKNSGSITGTLVLQDDIGDRKAILVSLTIEKLTANEVLPEENQNTSQIIQGNSSTNDQGEQETSTTTSAAVIVNDTVATSITTEIEGDVTLGAIIEDDVTAFNAEGQKVDIDNSKLTYAWFADGKAVGDGKELSITKDMIGKGINCKVSYDNGKEGNK
ncbi:hypothetical protein [uncultured Clostridium sp.]|uniref:hypothetical protein n=1 Tax=uncultured Clostridium sp. TaxID=59620 RepID=UPI0028E95AC3|nr:hypothetical protein [uncultured Clostridium sp.]